MHHSQNIRNELCDVSTPNRWCGGIDYFTYIFDLQFKVYCQNCIILCIHTMYGTHYWVDTYSVDTRRTKRKSVALCKTNNRCILHIVIVGLDNAIVPHEYVHSRADFDCVLICSAFLANLQPTLLSIYVR